ncbi:MAG: DUF4340 domain-containing protein [Phycisphaerales bacterium]|jgi:hypothetical protein|nr:DUF4340 domain-containing protein [Phycisphaerales bacterium]
MIRTTHVWILSLIAIVLSALTMWQRTVTVEPQQDEIALLLPPDAIEFNEVEKIILNRSDEKLVFERINGHWLQTHPFVCNMDTSSLMTLIERALGLLQLGVVEGEVSKEILGLGQNANSLTIETTDERVTISLGRMTLGGRAYASVNDGQPVTVSQSLHRLAIDTDHRYWRDIRLFPDVSIDSQRIERRIDDTVLRLDRSSGDWMIQEPVSARVHDAALVDWIGHLASAKLSSFVVDEPKDLSLFSLLSPRVSLSITDRGGETRTILIGGRVSAGSQNRYVKLKDTPMVCSMNWDSLSQLFPSTEIIAAPTGSGVSPFDVKRIRIATQDNETILRRELDSWVDETRGNKIIDAEQVRALLSWLLEAHPVSVAIGPYPRNLQVATITFEGYDRIPMDAVRIAQQEDGSFILDNGENVLRLHPADAGEVLLLFAEIN